MDEAEHLVATDLLGVHQLHQVAGVVVVTRLDILEQLLVPGQLGPLGPLHAAEDFFSLIDSSLAALDPQRDVPAVKHQPNWGAWTLHEQLADLGIGRRDIIYAPAKHTPLHNLAYPNADLSEQRLAHGGVLLHGLMWLDRIPQSEVDAVLAGLADGTGDLEDGT